MDLKGKVLIVDDDPDQLTLSRKILERSGYEVTTTCDGMECLGTASRVEPDLIILDVMFGGRAAGFDLVYRLKASAKTRSIPILMVTAVDDVVPGASEPEEFWNMLAAYLVKPIKPEDLLGWVDQTLFGRQTDAGSRSSTSRP